MTAAIKPRDRFIYDAAGHSGRVYTCDRLDVNHQGLARVVDEGGDMFVPAMCIRVRAVTRPIKTRKVKPSELRAWHRRGPFTLSGYTSGQGVVVGWMAWKRVGEIAAEGRGPTEAKAILALRKELRAKGVKL